MLDTEALRRLVDAQASVSDKIRALDRAGLKRAEIARFLGKRYQHVRNVLEADRQRDHGGRGAGEPNVPGYVDSQPAPPPRAGSAPAPVAIFRLTPGPDGSLRLPAHVLDAFGGRGAEVLLGIASPGELTVRTPESAIRRAQDLVRALIPGDDSLAESLVEDRRRDVETERGDG